MEYTLTQIFALTAGTALFLLAVVVLSPDAASRVTEALLERIELGLARRSRRRAGSAPAGLGISLFEPYGQGGTRR